MSDKIRVALYCRAARMNAEAIEHQKAMLREFAQEQGYSDMTVYSDNGYSGLNFIRPAFMQMESYIQAGLIDKVVIRDFSRISRDSFAAYAWLDKTRGKGVEVKSLYDDLGIPSNETKNAMYKAFREYNDKRK